MKAREKKKKSLVFCLLKSDGDGNVSGGELSAYMFIFFRMRIMFSLCQWAFFPALCFIVIYVYLFVGYSVGLFGCCC